MEWWGQKRASEGMIVSQQGAHAFQFAQHLGLKWIHVPVAWYCCTVVLATRLTAWRVILKIIQHVEFWQCIFFPLSGKITRKKLAVSLYMCIWLNGKAWLSISLLLFYYFLGFALSWHKTLNPIVDLRKSHFFHLSMSSWFLGMFSINFWQLW